jgi:hypothetical protein
MVEAFPQFPEQKTTDQIKIDQYYGLEHLQDFYEYVTGRMQNETSKFVAMQFVQDLDKYYPNKEFGYRLVDGRYEIFEK